MVCRSRSNVAHDKVEIYERQCRVTTSWHPSCSSLPIAKVVSGGPFVLFSCCLHYTATSVHISPHSLWSYCTEDEKINFGYVFTFREAKKNSLWSHFSHMVAVSGASQSMAYFEMPRTWGTKLEETETPFAPRFRISIYASLRAVAVQNYSPARHGISVATWPFVPLGRRQFHLLLLLFRVTPYILL